MEKKVQNDIHELMKDDELLEKLYHKLIPSATSHVCRNGGNAEEAKDLLQDSLIVLFRASQKSDFQLTSSVETYVFGIAKRKWLAELRKKRNNENKVNTIEEEQGNDLEQMIINSEKEELYIKHFRELTDSCKKLLQLFFKGLKMKEIADQLGFSSEGYVRKRKHNCQEKLIETIKQDPIFKELTDER